MGNGALQHNPAFIPYNGGDGATYLQNPSQLEHITTHGSDWYWAVMAAMAASAVAFIAMSLKVPRQKRIFHYITIGIVLVAAIAYYTMGSNLGSTYINVEYRRHGASEAGLARQIFYVRYIDWYVYSDIFTLNYG
jgi:bacteriorhodopsin